MLLADTQRTNRPQYVAKKVMKSNKNNEVFQLSKEFHVQVDSDPGENENPGKK